MEDTEILQEAIHRYEHDAEFHAIVQHASRAVARDSRRYPVPVVAHTAAVALVVAERMRMPPRPSADGPETAFKRLLTKLVDLSNEDLTVLSAALSEAKALGNAMIMWNSGRFSLMDSTKYKLVHREE